ncbi:lmo0937 family membrane protein [Salegentibacter sp.]
MAYYSNSYVAWLIGYIGFGEAVGNLIHILLILAIIGHFYTLLLRV